MMSSVRVAGHGTHDMIGDLMQGSARPRREYTGKSQMFREGGGSFVVSFLLPGGCRALVSFLTALLTLPSLSQRTRITKGTERSPDKSQSSLAPLSFRGSTWGLLSSCSTMSCVGKIFFCKCSAQSLEAAVPSRMSLTIVGCYLVETKPVKSQPLGPACLLMDDDEGYFSKVCCV